MLLLLLLFFVKISCSLKILLVLAENPDSNAKNSFTDFWILHKTPEPRDPIKLVLAPDGLSQSRLTYLKNENKNYCVIDLEEEDLLSYSVDNPGGDDTALDVRLLLGDNHHGRQKIDQFELNVFKCDNSVEFPSSVLENHENCIALYLLQENIQNPTVMYKGEFKESSENYIKFYGGWVNYLIHPTKYAYTNTKSLFILGHLPNEEPKYSHQDSIQEKKNIVLKTIENAESIRDIEWTHELQDDQGARDLDEKKEFFFDIIYYSTNRKCEERWVFIDIIFKRRQSSDQYSGYYKSPLFRSQCFSQRFRGSFYIEDSTLDDHHIKIFVNVLEDITKFPYTFEKIDVAFSDLNNIEPNDEIEACAGSDCVKYSFSSQYFEPREVSQYNDVTFSIISLMTLKTKWKICSLGKGSSSCKYFESDLNGEFTLKIYHDNDLIMVQGYKQVTIFTFQDYNRVFEVDDKVDDNIDITTSCMLLVKRNILKNIDEPPLPIPDTTTSETTKILPPVPDEEGSKESISTSTITKTEITETTEEQETEEVPENQDFTDKPTPSFTVAQETTKTTEKTTTSIKTTTKTKENTKPIIIPDTKTTTKSQTDSHTTKTTQDSTNLFTSNTETQTTRSPVNQNTTKMPKEKLTKNLEEYCKDEAQKRYPYSYIMFPISVVFFIFTTITMVFVIRKYKYEVYNFIGIKPPEYVDFHANFS